MKQTLIVEEVRVKENLRMTSKKPKKGVLVHYIIYHHYYCHPPLTSQAGHDGQHRCTGGHRHHGPHGSHHCHSQGQPGHQHIQPRLNLQSVETKKQSDPYCQTPRVYIPAHTHVGQAVVCD